MPLFSYFPHLWNKIPEQNNLRKKGLFCLSLKMTSLVVHTYIMLTGARGTWLSCIHRWEGERVNVGSHLALFFLFSPRSQPMESCHPQSGWIFPYQLTQSRNFFGDKLMVLSASDSGSC